MTTLRPDFKFLLAHPAHLIAFGFGSGLAPKAPGTVGTVLGWPLLWLIVAITPDLPTQLVLLLASFLLGVWACGKSGRALGVADHGGMVWDEVVAFALVLLFTPAGWMWAGLAFLLFRFFEAAGAVRTAVSVVKSRTSEHEKTIREIRLTADGIEVGEALSDFQGVMSGLPSYDGAVAMLGAEAPANG